MRLRAAATLGLVLLSACAGRNIHSDLTPDTKILTRGWTFSTHGPYDTNDRGYEYSGAVLYENTLIFGNASTGVTALYPGLLRVRWTFPVQNGVVSELNVDKKSLYFGGADGTFYCLNADTGKVIWKFEIKQTLLSKPTISGGRVFVTSADDTIYAFDAGTGKSLWSYRRRTPQTATIHAASSPLVDAGEVIAGMSDGFIVAVSQEDGALKWERKLQITNKFMDVDAAPVLMGDTIYEPSYDGALYAMKRKGGETVWRFDGGGARKVSVDDAAIYLPSSNGTVYALAKANAKVLWQFELDRGVPTSIVLTDRFVIFASSHQYLYVLDKATGKGLYRYNVGDGSGFSSNPVYDKATDSFYILSMAGNLYQFNVRKAGAKDPDLYRFESAYLKRAP
ncbi:MAG: PQQ-binding-like beta-propeller repeat protein [Bdellovibrionales bacterium]|nr:PQQ-binding-like beta-propeller repeat protein [Bdellovibrionales bacterium]